MNYLEEADNIITSPGFFGIDYEKAIMLYQKSIPFASDNEKIFILQKLIYCFQKLNCKYDVACCYREISQLSSKLNLDDSESVYKFTISLFYEIDFVIAGKCCIELGEFYEKRNQFKEASEMYQQAASNFYKDNIYAYYHYMLKSGDLLPESDAIECYEKIILFCEEELKHYMNHILLKIYICKKILNQEFEMKKEFIQSSEYETWKNKTPVNDWFKIKFEKFT